VHLRHTNIVLSLPMDAPAIPVTIHHPHPCGGYYVAEAWVYGPEGRIGRWQPNG